ncbi:MAG: shikimate dehydrogenase [Gammaproteobacteria bacterium]|nr:shikimate dehydrogenase [Gammaproteobacteria bacterium]
MPPSPKQPDRYALIGYPVEHSRSPLIHQLFARQTGQNLTYELIDASPEQFETAVLGFRAAGGLGLNVTVPHKEAAFAISQEHGPEAESAGAVNTLHFVKNRIRGDNTDGIGFIRDLTINQEQSLASSRVLVLGAGGAARGIIGPILAQEPAELTVANRTLERAEKLRNELGSPERLTTCSFDDLGDAAAFDIVINATSAGLHGEQPPFPASLIRSATFCYDLAYSVKPTPFVDWALANGAERAVQGWGMLVEQAAESFEIWRGTRPDTAPILETLNDLVSAS